MFSFFCFIYFHTEKYYRELKTQLQQTEGKQNKNKIDLDLSMIEEYDCSVQSILVSIYQAPTEGQVHTDFAGTSRIGK